MNIFERTREFLCFHDVALLLMIMGTSVLDPCKAENTFNGQVACLMISENVVFPRVKFHVFFAVHTLHLVLFNLFMLLIVCFKTMISQFCSATKQILTEKANFHEFSDSTLSSLVKSYSSASTFYTFVWICLGNINAHAPVNE